MRSKHSELLAWGASTALLAWGGLIFLPKRDSENSGKLSEAGLLLWLGRFARVGAMSGGNGEGPAKRRQSVGAAIARLAGETSDNMKKPNDGGRLFSLPCLAPERDGRCARRERAGSGRCACEGGKRARRACRRAGAAFAAAVCLRALAFRASALSSQFARWH